MGFNFKHLIPGYSLVQFLRDPSENPFGRAAGLGFLEQEKQSTDPYASQRAAQALAQKQVEEQRQSQIAKNSAFERLFKEEHPTPPAEQRESDDYVPADYTTKDASLDLRYHPNELKAKKKGFSGLSGMRGI